MRWVWTLTTVAVGIATGFVLGSAATLALPSGIDTVTVAAESEPEPIPDPPPGAVSPLEHLAHQASQPAESASATRGTGPTRPARGPEGVERDQAQAADARPLPDGPSPQGPLGIPARLLDAYQTAAGTVGSACGLSWQVLAAVGQVETSHANGGRVFDDGVTWEPILGPVLDGRGFAAIADSDDGRLDGNREWDRAVGPMQFLPGTWAWIGTDGDGDGTRDPHDIDDAAASAARYLCAHGGDLSQEAALRAALLRYNNSTAYVDTVLAWAAAYGDRVAVTETPTRPKPDDDRKAKDEKKSGTKDETPRTSTTTDPTSSKDSGSSGSTTPKPSQEPEPTQDAPVQEPVQEPPAEEPPAEEPPAEEPPAEEPPVEEPPAEEPPAEEPPAEEPPAEEPPAEEPPAEEPPAEEPPAEPTDGTTEPSTTP